MTVKSAQVGCYTITSTDGGPYVLTDKSGVVISEHANARLAMNAGVALTAAAYKARAK